MNLKLVSLGFFLLMGLQAGAQSFSLVDANDTYSSGIAQTIKIPLKIKNNTEKAQFYVIRITDSELSGTQKGAFCIDKTCHESTVTEFSKRIEAGATLDALHYSLETGLVTGQYSIHFEIFIKGGNQNSIQHAVNINVEEKVQKNHIFQSREITIHDVYPNPVIDVAHIDYKLHSESVKAKLVVHNILGAPLANIDLSYNEFKAKILADEFTPGVYFYTVYLDNVGVVTRKLIVRR